MRAVVYWYFCFRDFGGNKTAYNNYIKVSKNVNKRTYSELYFIASKGGYI